jgi:hypothetical protein
MISRIPVVIPFFLAVAAVLFVLAARESFRGMGRRTLARETWIRTGLIFVAVAMILYLVVRSVP